MSDAVGRKKPYFSRDKSFYKAVFTIMLMVSLQNIVNYSVNMADNIMLGSWSESALAGATCVNQFFFVVTSFVSGLNTSYAVLGSQYWGRRNRNAICGLTGVALRFSLGFGALVTLLLFIMPRTVVSFFTEDPAIIAEGLAYLKIVRWQILPYCLSMVFVEVLRSVETVRISFVLSVVSLAINATGNWLLIYGKLGLPALGVVGAGIATVLARFCELGILIWYVAKKETKLQLFSSDFLSPHPELRRDYVRVGIPIVLTGMAWSIATPLQSSILGHVSSIAIAANSVSSTFYQYIKVIALAMSSASMVVVGKTVGSGDRDGAEAGAHSLEIIDLLLGCLLAGILFLLRNPLLSLYADTLAPETLKLAEQLIGVMCIIMIFMSYQVPVLFGSLRGSGDTRFSSAMNITFVWVVSIPSALLSAFVWHWSIPGVVFCIQSDQIIKCVPAFLRLHCSGGKWMHNLTK